jgi:hypothetical protein
MQMCSGRLRAVQSRVLARFGVFDEHGRLFAITDATRRTRTMGPMIAPRGASAFARPTRERIFEKARGLEMCKGLCSSGSEFD